MFNPEYLKTISYIPHTCENCEMNFSGKCAANKSQPIEDPASTCEHWDASLDAYCEACAIEKEEKERERNERRKNAHPRKAGKAD